MFFCQRNWSPLLFISRSSSFPIIWVNVHSKIKWKERLTSLLLLFFSKSPGSHVIYRQNKRGAWNAKFDLSYNILLPRWADVWLPSPSSSVCADRRWYADVITKFSQMDRLPNFLSYGVLLMHARRCAIKSGKMV